MANYFLKIYFGVIWKSCKVDIPDLVTMWHYVAPEEYIQFLRLEYRRTIIDQLKNKERKRQLFLFDLSTLSYLYS